MPAIVAERLAEVTLPLECSDAAEFRIVPLPSGVVIVSAFWTESLGGAGESACWRAAVVGCTLAGDVEPIHIDPPEGTPAEATGTAPQAAGTAASFVVAETDARGSLYVFDVEHPAPLHKFGSQGSPLGYARARMLDPEADVAIADDETVWWCAPSRELGVQRFDAIGDALGRWEPKLPPDVQAILPESLAIDLRRQIWLAGTARVNSDADNDMGSSSSADPSLGLIAKTPTAEGKMEWTQVRVLCFEAGGECVGGLFDVPPHFLPVHIRMDHRQRLWAAEPANGRLSVFNVAGDRATLLGTIACSDLGLLSFSPTRVTIAAGRLFHISPGQRTDDGTLIPPTLNVWRVAE